jgi:hypothetical protein
MSAFSSSTIVMSLAVFGGGSGLGWRWREAGGLAVGFPRSAGTFAGDRAARASASLSILLFAVIPSP